MSCQSRLLSAKHLRLGRILQALFVIERPDQGFSVTVAEYSWEGNLGLS